MEKNATYVKGEDWKRRNGREKMGTLFVILMKRSKMLINVVPQSLKSADIRIKVSV